MLFLTGYLLNKQHIGRMALELEAILQCIKITDFLTLLLTHCARCDFLAIVSHCFDSDSVSPFVIRQFIHRLEFIFITPCFDAAPRSAWLRTVH